MYLNGAVITLKEDKVHGTDPENMLSIKAGICGMVMEGSRAPDGNHHYVVDFGPEGQWNCVHNELDGDDAEGWEHDTTPIPQDVPAFSVHSGTDTHLRLRPSEEPLIEIKSESRLVVDPEADINQRIKQLEKGRIE